MIGAKSLIDKKIYLNGVDKMVEQQISKEEKEARTIDVNDYVNEAGTSNEVGVTDEIGKDLIKNQLLSLYAEEEAFVKARENALEGLENYEKQWLIDKELLELQLNNFGMLDSAKTHIVHTIPRFWELQKEQFGYKVRQETFQAEQTIKSFEREVETADKQLERIRKSIADKVKELEDLGMEIPSRDSKESLKL